MNELKKIWQNNFSDEEKSCYIEKNEFKSIKYDLSIIIPVYNAEEFLSKCLKSILNQNSNFKFEIVLINDGSTDNSKKICEEYSQNNKNILYIEQNNKGASAARNMGLKNCSGEYICFIDSDDYIAPNFVEKMVSTIKKENADYIKCGYNEFDSKTDTIVKRVKLNNKIYSGNNSFKKNIKGHACMCVFRRELMKNIKFPEGYWYEDIIIKFLLLPQCKKIITISDQLYYYRVNINSTSNNEKSKRELKCISQLYLLIDCVNCYKKINLNYDKCFYKNFYNESFAMLWLRTRKLDDETIRKLFNVLCEYYVNEINNQKYNNISRVKDYTLKKNKFFLWKILSFINYIFIR